MKKAVDLSGLKALNKKLAKGGEAVKPAMTKSLNKVGDDLVSTLTQRLSKESGLPVERVRGMMRVKRATKNDMAYKLTVDGRIWDDDPRTLEGKRESRDFGKIDPSSMVIIVNQDDDLVCMDCEELAAAGPMPLKIAKEHIPKHPNCRCIIMPWAQRGRRAPVTMTSLSGTSAEKRSGKPNRDLTVRQMAQEILNKTMTNIKIELK